MIRAALLLSLLPFTLLANEQWDHEDPAMASACDARWPGRFIELGNNTVYDCNASLIVAKASPLNCANSTLEECYGDE